MNNRYITLAIIIILTIAGVLLFIYKKRATTVPPTETPISTSTINTYTLANISAHKNQTDCWTTINGKVYDITAYIPKHPGGVQQIMQVCGKDGSFLFEDQHSEDRKPKNVLASFMIGNLVK